MTALVLAHAALVLLVVGVRFASDLDIVLGPVTASWPWLVGVTAALAVMATRREWVADARPWRDPDAAAAWILLVLGPAVLWALGDRILYRGPDAGVVAVLVAVGVGVAFRHRSAWTNAHAWWSGGGGAARWLALGTLVVAIAVIAVGRFVDDDAPVGPRWWLALATYPAYASLQLAVAMVLPIHVARRRGASSTNVVIACAALFALIHAPNPVAVTLTGLGMLAWASAHLRGVGFGWLALSMGLLGATVAQGLPDRWTENMRVGAAYVQSLATERTIAAYDARVVDLASDAFFREAGGSTRAWLEAVYREVFEGPPVDEVVDDWAVRVENAYRAQLARRFLDTDFFRERNGIERRLDGRDRQLFFSTFEPWHPAHERVRVLWDRPRDAPIDRSFENDLVAIYEATLERTPAAHEVDGWSRWPRERDRFDVVRIVLFQAGRVDPAVWRRPDVWPRWAAPR